VLIESAILYLKRYAGAGEDISLHVGPRNDGVERRSELHLGQPEFVEAMNWSAMADGMECWEHTPTSHPLASVSFAFMSTSGGAC
ncbi:MAG TPA: hypothetical protein VKP69_20545, partial [Isosphaeraceae bacterium]|nr:hypothetical protein [Isosphaeraceae bacterium]